MSTKQLDLRIIELPNGSYIDPAIIGGLDVLVNNRPYKLKDGSMAEASVEIETLGKRIKRIHCKDLAGARRLAKTLWAKANYHHVQAQKAKERVRVHQRTNWDGMPMPGDTDYFAEAEKHFKATHLYRQAIPAETR